MGVSDRFQIGVSIHLTDGWHLTTNGHVVSFRWWHGRKSLGVR